MAAWQRLSRDRPARFASARHVARPTLGDTRHRRPAVSDPLAAEIVDESCSVPNQRSQPARFESRQEQSQRGGRKSRARRWWSYRSPVCHDVGGRSALSLAIGVAARRLSLIDSRTTGPAVRRLPPDASARPPKQNPSTNCFSENSRQFPTKTPGPRLPEPHQRAAALLRRQA
jgi:hypothetical protein